MAESILRCLAPALIAPLLAAAAPAVPQQRQIDSGLRSLRPSLASEQVRPSGNRFPLEFPFTRAQAQLRAASGLRVGVHSHGAAPGRYASISFELLFRDLARHFEEDVRTFRSAMAAVGIAEAARGEALAGVRALNARLVAAKPWGNTSPDRPWFQARADEARAAGRLRIRIEGKFWRGTGGSGGLVLVQITDARAPQALWPALPDVERLFPYSRRRGFDAGADILDYPDPLVTGLSCRSRGPDRYRCRYRASPHGRFADDFARVGGEWRLLASDSAPASGR